MDQAQEKWQSFPWSRSLIMNNWSVLAKTSSFLLSDVCNLRLLSYTDFLPRLARIPVSLRLFVFSSFPHCSQPRCQASSLERQSTQAHIFECLSQMVELFGKDQQVCSCWKRCYQEQDLRFLTTHTIPSVSLCPVLVDQVTIPATIPLLCHNKLKASETISPIILFL